MHCLEDLAVPGAAADVPRERLADLRVARLGVALQERLRGHDEPRRAEAALHGTGFHERHLERMHPAVARKRLHGLDLLVRTRAGEDEAAADELAVEHDGARPALALLARVLAAGELELLA